MNNHAAIAISGGIDSLYAAYLLKQSGYQVTGIHFITGYEDHPELPETDHGHNNAKVICDIDSPIGNSAKGIMGFIADQLDIPIHIFDISRYFKENVVDYFINGYRTCTTPSPCMVCNPSVKFGLILDYALKLGASFLATGHYARIHRDETGTVHLLKGVDRTKDQSYFLAFLTNSQLNKSLFPLGDKTKKDIKLAAEKAGLKPVSSGESQDVCFIKDDYKLFLKDKSGFNSEPGPIKTTEGTIVGEHNGLSSFTIGQRRGINCPAPYPYYVIEMNPETNTLVVGPKTELLSDKCTIEKIHWINATPHYPFKAETRIRHSHKGVGSVITQNPEGNQTWTIRFDEPVSAVTPGQAAVFYRGDEVLGAGWIRHNN